MRLDFTLDEWIVECRAAVDAFIQHAASLTTEQWITPRAPGKWPPALDAKHLSRGFTGLAAEVRDGPHVDPSSYPPRIPWLREKLLPRILAGGYFPAGGEAPDFSKPPDYLEPQNEVLAEIAISLHEFEHAIRAMHESHPHRMVRHPYFGALTLAQLLKVTSEHTAHHKRFLPAAASPA